MIDSAVILTYPAHFYQTCLTIASIRQHLRYIDRIYVLVDDISNLAWPNYVDHCRRQYQVNDLILVSGISGISALRSWPYVRQQVVKLMLDTVIAQESWLFVDGDVVLNNDLPDGIFGSKVRYQGANITDRDPEPGEKSSQILFYIRRMLGTDFRGFWDNEGAMITTSHPPVHRMRADVLRKLRHYLISTHDQNIVELHLVMAKDDRVSVCEWDLLEVFRQQILGEEQNFNLELPGVIDTTWSSDRELGLRWFQERDVNPDPRIWQQLPLVKYL